MKMAIDLLRAHRIGIRDLKEHLSTKSLGKLLVITDRGTPVSVNLPYSEVLELIDLIDEVLDSKTVSAVAQGRKAIEQGTKGVPVSVLFKKVRQRRR